MKFGILTFTSTDEEYTKLANISLANKKEYCDIWNYSLYLLTDKEIRLPIFYAKYETMMFAYNILNNTSDLDWLWVLDIDTVITNYTKPLDNYVDNDYHFIIATDFNEINAGSYFVRNSEQGKAFLKSLLDQFDKYSKLYGREQQAIIDNHTFFKDIIKIVPQKKINSYQYDLYDFRYHKAMSRKDSLGENGEWSKDDSLLIHFPDTSNEMRYNLMQKYIKEIVR